MIAHALKFLAVLILQSQLIPLRVDLAALKHMHAISQYNGATPV